jgi:biopolymer transport protein ExbD
MTAVNILNSMENFVSWISLQSYDMTEINFVALTKNKFGIERKVKTTRKSLRIDMTPMVDLGFLLITFFIFTTEISKPSMTHLNMPHEGLPIKLPGSKSLTILLNGPNKIFYYYGIEFLTNNQQVHQTSFDELKGLGRVIREKQLELEHRHIDKAQLVVLIKPGDETSYQDFVGVLDEMLINKVTQYAVVDLEKEETAYLERHK